jgi:hypothetical protein
MSYDAVADKFTHLVEPVLPHRSEPLRVAVGSLPETDSVRELQLLTLPVSEVTR